jgi:hypothetical protein
VVSGVGYELYREVMRWAPASLTKGEKLAALVLADDANDDSRLTWSSVVDPEIMRQAMVPDERAMLRIIAKLKTEKVVEHNSGGHNGKVAKYKFLTLAPVDAPVKGGENAHPTDGKGGENHPATRGEGWQESPPYVGPSGDPMQKITTLRGAKGGDFLPRRVVKTTTPTPYPLTTSSSPADVIAAEQHTQGGGGGGEQPELLARATEFVDGLDYRGRRPSRSQHGKLCLGVVRALDAGWPERDLKEYLNLGESTVKAATAIYGHRLDPAELPEPPAATSGLRTTLPPWCGHCGDDNPAAERNPRFRLKGGTPCPTCHPDATRSAT